MKCHFVISSNCKLQIEGYCLYTYHNCCTQHHFMKTSHLLIPKELKTLFCPPTHQFFSETWNSFTGSQIPGNKEALQLQQPI